MKKKLERGTIRKKRVRAKIWGTKTRPRLSVFRSNRHIFLQLINDDDRKTILSYGDDKIKRKTNKTEISKEAGKKLAEMAREKKIKRVVFDKGGYKYHGRIKAAAEAAREGGLEF